MDAPSPSTALQVVVISPGSADCFRLTGPYLEEVWSEFLGAHCDDPY